MGDTEARRWYRLEDTIFLVVPFLAQFAIPCNVLSVLASFKFSERLETSCSKAMAFRMVEIEQ